MNWNIVFSLLRGSNIYETAAKLLGVVAGFLAAKDTDREGSDEDRKGILVGPPSWYFGFVGGPEQITHTDDHVWMEVRKVVRLAEVEGSVRIRSLGRFDADLLCEWRGALSPSSKPPRADKR